MHVVTFYSFKGGVGRTLALVNIGVELANTGRRVLLVDFDLEAPGIDTFEQLRPPEPCPGIVDYITTYLDENKAPAVNRFLYETTNVGNGSGKLWVMPAGKRDGDYGARLASIDWDHLYAERDGFLLMEHLKSQWEETLKPDYVLVDSRTGHTEVGGICTRQLPNTVVVLFIPNEQNIEGVGVVVDAIRSENEQSGVDINIELVASNVPSLDDEEQILRRMLSRFERRLVKDNSRRTRSAILTINRYDSMHLLNQSIFVTERPHSRLAKQYRSLLRRIIQHNLEDRQAALREISNHFPRPVRARFIGLRAADFEPVLSDDSEQKIQNILAYHANDAEINFMLGQLYKAEGDLDKAGLFFGRATDIAAKTNDSARTRYELEHLETLINQGKTEGASDKLASVLERELQSAEVKQALALLVRAAECPRREWLGLSALSQLEAEDLSSIVWTCCVDRSWQDFAMSLYFRRRERQCTEDTTELAVDIVLAAIGTRHYELVLNAVDERTLMSKADIQTCFNYAMAKWGKDGHADHDIFARVVHLDEGREQPDPPNYEQCLAVASAVVGSTDTARTRLENARRTVGTFSPLEFSCWSYLRVDESTFLSDLDQIEMLIAGHPVRPSFMQ